MRFRWLALAAAIAVAGWALWHYLRFRSCGERFCIPSADVPPIRLETGQEIPVLSTHMDRERRLVIDYLTSHDRNDLTALCAEAESVWAAARARLETGRMERVVLGPTSPESEFLGMQYGVVPLHTCCISTRLEAEKDRSGTWIFPRCRG